MNIANKDNYALSINDIDTPALCSAPDNVPHGFSWVRWTPMFRYAWDEITKGGHEIVTVLGQGGSGKSVLLEMVYSLSPARTLVIAPTGIAAFRLIQDGIPASTIHSAFGFRPQIWQDPSRIKTQALDVLMGVDTVLIDEISMVDCNLLDAVLAQIKASERKTKRKIKTVFFGDIYQLPPVASGQKDEATKDMWLEAYGEGMMFFYSTIFRESERINIELCDVHRQSSAIFRGILERIRLGQATLEDLRLLNRHVFSEKSFRETIGSDGMMYLAGTNRLVDDLNDAYTGEFALGDNDHRSYRAEIEGDATLQDFRMPSRTVSIYVGMSVMCLANESDGAGHMIYQNGTIGRVIRFNHSGLPVVAAADGREFTVQKHTFIKYSPEINENGKLKMVETGSVYQIGCRPAYAVTFHKSQGLTLDAVYIDISQWTAPGSVYLGLSRLRTEAGLGLKKPLRLRDIRLSPETEDFYDREIISAPEETA